MNSKSADPFSRFQNLIRRSLAARLLTIAILSICSLVAGGAVAYDQFNRQMLRLLIDPQLYALTDVLVGGAARGDDGQLALRGAPADARFTQTLGGRYYQILRIGEGGALEVRFQSDSLFRSNLELGDSIRARLVAPDATLDAQYFNIVGPDREPLRLMARVQEIPDVAGRYLFLVAIDPREALEESRNFTGRAFAVFLAFCALIVAAISVLQVRIGLEPLRDLRRDIASVRRGDAERLAGEYPAELQPVAAELNALVDHNREVVERARRHVGNLAHALKTPIAVLKNATAGGQGDGAVLRQSVAEMESFVERQLRRARVAARAEAHAGAQAPIIAYRTSVRRNLEDLVFMMEQKYETQKAIDLSLEEGAEVTFRGEREDLLEMVSNLIDNACKYGKSTVLIRLVPPTEANGLFEVVVEDDGPGLSDDQLARAMARGARLDEAAPGQGLGLSILRETVDLYAGELLFERGSLGGLKARLRLPATD